MTSDSIDLRVAFEKGSVAILCGAGVSFNSSIPTVWPLMRRILTHLGVEDQDIQTYLERAPFESFMEIVRNKVDIKDLLTVFDVRNPNENHQLFAELLKQGIATTIFTTNFDLNVELALHHIALTEGKDFNVVRDPLQSNPTAAFSKPSVIKLHGSIDDEKSIWTTIDRVANKSNAEKLVPYLEHLILNGPHKFVVILGYSFSDKFDIGPVMTKLLTKSDKTVINIEHMRDDTVAWVKRPLGSNSIDQLSINTDRWAQLVSEKLA